MPLGGEWMTTEIIVIYTRGCGCARGRGCDRAFDFDILMIRIVQS